MFWATFLVLKIVKVAKNMEVASYYWMKKGIALAQDQTMDLSRSATSATLLSNTIEQIIYYIKHMEKLSPPFSPFAQPGKGVFSPCIV